MKKYLLSVIVLAIFALGFAASDEDESSVGNDSNESVQNKEVKHDFFENGYKYTTSYRIKREKGWGISSNYDYTITIYKDGTKEIKFKQKADGEYPLVSGTEDCKIIKKSSSYKDVAATWYEVSWTYLSSYGGKIHNTPEIIIVDENGNVISPGENGKASEIHQAIANRDCIFGRFSKQPF